MPALGGGREVGGVGDGRLDDHGEQADEGERQEQKPEPVRDRDQGHAAGGEGQVPDQKQASVEHVAQRHQEHQADQVAELSCGDDPSQIGFGKPQVVADSGEYGLGRVDGRDRHRADRR